MVARYQGSPIRLLAEVYPEYNWLPWRYAKCPENYFDDLKNQRKFLEWVAFELKIKEINDWYKVSYKV